MIFLSFHVGDLIELSHVATMPARAGMVLAIEASTFLASVFSDNKIPTRTVNNKPTTTVNKVCGNLMEDVA